MLIIMVAYVHMYVHMLPLLYIDSKLYFRFWLRFEFELSKDFWSKSDFDLAILAIIIKQHLISHIISETLRVLDNLDIFS